MHWSRNEEGMRSGVGVVVRNEERGKGNKRQNNKDQSDSIGKFGDTPGICLLS